MPSTSVRGKFLLVRLIPPVLLQRRCFQNSYSGFRPVSTIKIHRNEAALIDRLKFKFHGILFIVTMASETLGCRVDASTA